MQQTPSESDELLSILDELEQLAPHRPSYAEPFFLRILETDEVIDDVEPPINDEELEEDWQLEQIIQFRGSRSLPMVAVDSSIVRLGETEDGLVIAMRGCIVSDNAGQRNSKIFRSGTIYLRNTAKKTALYHIGRSLGKEDLFVELDNQGNPLTVKHGVADDSHQYADRFRNWFERLIQKIAIGLIQNGIVLLDGALTLRTRDTPASFLQELASRAVQHGNAIIGISKQSRLQVDGRPVQFMLRDHPNEVGYRRISDLLRSEALRESQRAGEPPRVERVMGNIYVCRFTPLGACFRTDVKALEGQSDDEVLNYLYSSTIFKSGYPDILVQAHSHCYFTAPDVIQLQAEAATKYRFRPFPEIDLKPIFAPFGGRFK